MPAPPRILLTAEEAYPALERLALSARDSLSLSFRILDPTTRLRSTEARDLALPTWGDLAAHVAAKGVKVRLLIADFDPVFATWLHIGAWEAAHGFADATKGGPAPEILLCRHPAGVGAVWRTLLTPTILMRIRELKAEGLWDRTPAIAEAAKARRLSPVTLHQKLSVADGTRAIVGGLDVDERRFDTPAHDRPSEATWHDVSLAVEGPLATAAQRHFGETWNAALDSLDSCNPEICGGTRAPLPSSDIRGGAFLRTVSIPRKGPLHFGPETTHRDHEEAHLKLFAQAENLVFLETQFFRHKPLAEALAAAAARAPNLNCILILPVAPERVLFDGDRGLDARYGQKLQLDCLNRLKQAFGDRLAVMTPLRPRSPYSNVTHKGADIVYVHAKVTLVDDRHTIVGSANLNGRSMLWDTEASFHLDDPDTARSLRARLTDLWLGSVAEGEDTTRAATWAARARANTGAKPEDRKGFLLPYPESKTRRFARHAPFLPAAMF